MIVFHTSDWHLGKQLYKHSRHRDQKDFFDFFFEQIDLVKPEMIWITGDIFDQYLPDQKSLELYFDILNRIECRDFIKKTIIIAGNHDSEDKIRLPLYFLDENRFHIPSTKSWDEYFNHYPLHYKGLTLVPLPFLGHQSIDRLRDQLSIDDNSSAELILTKLFERLGILSSSNSILLFHHFISDMDLEGSEYDLSFKGLSSIPPHFFTPYFSLLALGHLHNPQTKKIKNTYLTYSGSPISYHFTKKQRNKGFNIIEFNHDKVRSITPHYFDEKKSLEILSINNFDNLPKVSKKNNYIQLRISSNMNLSLDEYYKIVNYYKEYNIIDIQFLIDSKVSDNQIDFDSKTNLSSKDLFELYHQYKFNHPASSELIEDFQTIWQDYQSCSKEKFLDHS